MAVSNIKVTFPNNVQTVWEAVTNLESYGWRSDLSKLDIINDKQFIEYSKDGYPTTFTVTLNELHKRWEFDLENDNITGHWTGIFTANKSSTEIDFMEEVTTKKIIMKPFIKSYLKKQQSAYIHDLKLYLQQQK